VALPMSVPVEQWLLHQGAEMLSVRSEITSSSPFPGFRTSCLLLCSVLQSLLELLADGGAQGDPEGDGHQLEPIQDGEYFEGPL